jgi:vitamin B12 transporter
LRALIAKTSSQKMKRESVVFERRRVSSCLTDTMPSSSLSRLAGRSLIVPALLAPVSLLAQLSAPDTAGQQQPVALDRLVVSATRSPQDLNSVPSSVTPVSVADLAVEQVGDLRTALAQQPGVNVTTNGAFGGLSYVSIRGASNYETLLVIDGVRMNDRSADYGNFLGGADLANVARLEVLRGPQSTLYGSSAMGGVVLIDSVEGEGPASGEVSVEGGSFNTWGAAAAASGSINGFSYSGSVGHFSTANDRDDNGLREWSFATRLAYRVNANFEVGATFRGLDGQYEEPGSTAFVSPGAVNSQNYLATVFGEARVSDAFTSKLTIGLHHRLYDFLSSFGESPLRNIRHVLDWQNTWEVSRQLELIAGTNFENSRYTVDGARTTDRLGAGYVSATVRPVKEVTVMAGLRYDDYKSVGSATTYRVGVAWNPAPETKVHSTFGTSFAAPGSDDRYGVPSFGQLPNPDLKPEKARGWDIGVSEDLAGGKATADVTYFHNHYRNLFQWQYVDFETFTGMTVNVASATTDGVEAALTYNLDSQWKFRGAYTYLNANDDAAGTRLARHPRHVLDSELVYQPNVVWNVGAGLHWVADQVDGSGEFPDYTTVRVFASYAPRQDWLLKVRLENALDRHYEETRGYPALPFGAFGSVEWKF